MWTANISTTESLIKSDEWNKTTKSYHQTFDSENMKQYESLTSSLRARLSLKTQRERTQKRSSRLNRRSLHTFTHKRFNLKMLDFDHFNLHQISKLLKTIKPHLDHHLANFTTHKSQKIKLQLKYLNISSTHQWIMNIHRSNHHRHLSHHRRLNQLLNLVSSINQRTIFSDN
jgi:hypothetical protein